MKTTTLMKWLIICAAFLFSGNAANAQLAFTDANAALSVGGVYSGCAVTVTDVNFDGLDDIFRMDQGHMLSLLLQNRDGSFTGHSLLSIGSGSSWAMTCADIDHNGWKDAIMDGDNGIQVIKVFETAGTITYTTSVLTNSGFFLQNATFCDMNNDGWIDLFCCDDNAAAHVYMNDGAGNLQVSSYVNFAVNPGIFYGNDPADSGNYGSAWIDFDNDGDLDLYVAHCRQSTSSPTDLRRINRLFVNDGTNHYTEQATAFGIDVGWQTWTSSFGDIDNDGDLDLMLTNHDHTSQIFENDGTGHYTELTTTGFNTSAITPIESVMEDFDNDGYNDILVAGSEWVYWKNNGNKTFTQVSGLFANNGMLSFATGDLNHDGFVDVYASYGDIYTSPSSYTDVLYLNQKNTNHFITFNLKGTASNIGAIGGRATIYGPWGVQVREIRAGESYGTCNSSQLHFGLGSNATVDSAVIWFPSGNTTHLYNLQSDQFVTVLENTCTITGNIITGPSVICTGQTATLNGAAGFTSYDWTGGQTTPSVSVSSPGTYNLLVTDGNGCSNISPNIDLQQNPDETPTVSTAGDLTFCHGGSVDLTSSTAVSYLWSDGSSGQTLTVTEAGSYTVTIQGVCGQFTSNPVTVDVLAAPVPVGTGASIVGPGSVVLTATGSDLYWYDQPTGGTLLGQGPSFTTPVLSSTTTYWVENATAYPGASHATGMPYHQGTLYSGGTTNGTNDFTVTAPCTLASVKVYTDSVGQREIQLLDASNAVVQSLLVNIPVDTSRVTLNFALTPGTYHLTTNATVNQANFGTVSPRLQRSSLGVSYPYTVNNLLSITGSNQGGNYYYYFFDWDVQEASFNCISDRIPVIADILDAVGSINSTSGLKVFPNPTRDLVNIESDNASAVTVAIYDTASRLVKHETFHAQANRLSISGLAEGIYQLQIIKEGAAHYYKLVIQ